MTLIGQGLEELPEVPKKKTQVVRLGNIDLNAQDIQKERPAEASWPNHILYNLKGSRGLLSVSQLALKV